MTKEGKKNYINVNKQVMAKGVIFDIKEFALFDGPGIRTTVFFKGCPLACKWCHNPEGLSYEHQLMVSPAGCTHCGKCITACSLPENTAEIGKNALPYIPMDCCFCGKCLLACPAGLRRIAGEECDAEDLANKLLRNADYLRHNGGGFTFSGGEPTGQGEFLMELLVRLRGNHRAIETCGFCEGKLFAMITAELDLVIMDIKLADPELHKRFTGQDNSLILTNLEQLKANNTPFILRIPLIPGITDTKENLRSIASFCSGKSRPEKVEFLPYHKTAGAKYNMLGMEYKPDFDINQAPEIETACFSDIGITWSIL